MDVPHSRAVLRKPPALQIALPTIAPLVVAVFGTEVTMVIGPFVLVGWCVVFTRFRCLAQSGLIRSSKNISTVLGCRSHYSIDLGLAEAGVHCACS
jgi:hypothetical protein